MANLALLPIIDQPADWPKLLREHLESCRQCRENALDLCRVGHVMVMFAGEQQFAELRRRYEAAA